MWRYRAKSKRAGATKDPDPEKVEFAYFKRSLRFPFFSLAAPLL
jgi:hypothetical protein